MNNNIYRTPERKPRDVPSSPPRMRYKKHKEFNYNEFNLNGVKRVWNFDEESKNINTFNLRRMF